MEAENEEEEEAKKLVFFEIEREKFAEKKSERYESNEANGRKKARRERTRPSGQ